MSSPEKIRGLWHTPRCAGARVPLEPQTPQRLGEGGAALEAILEVRVQFIWSAAMRVAGSRVPPPGLCPSSVPLQSDFRLPVLPRSSTLPATRVVQ